LESIEKRLEQYFNAVARYLFAEATATRDNPQEAEVLANAKIAAGVAHQSLVFIRDCAALLQEETRTPLTPELPRRGPLSPAGEGEGKEQCIADVRF
jgi:hypothetical protein